jgi:biotin carboxylase
MRHLGVVESNLSGSGFDGLRIAKELGCHVTFFTSGIDRYLAVPGGTRHLEAYVDDVELCQTNELLALLERARAVHGRRPFDGFMSMAEYEVVAAAQVARALGLPTPDPDAVQTARNKVLMRRRCAEHGVPMPAFASVGDGAAAARAAREIGLPCIVKPADETASADVRRCNTIEEVVAHVEAIRSQPRNVRGQLRWPEVLVEEYAVGHEVSVEVLASGSRLHVLGVTDKVVGGNNCFVELGHLFPSMLPEEVRRACVRVATDALRAVGFDLGLAHVEVKYTSAGPRLIEVNPRPAGDKIHELVDLSLDLSCLELVVRQYLGEPLPERIRTRPARAAAIRFMTGEPGRVAGVGGLDVAAGLPGVREAVAYVRPGDVVGPLRRNEDRIGHAVAVADDPYVAARLAELAVGQMAVAMESRAQAVAA